MENSFKHFYSFGNITILILLITLGLLITFYSPNDHSLFPCPNSNPSMATKSTVLQMTTESTTESDDLTTVLERASMGNNKTVIVAVVNKAYVESIDGGHPAVNMLDLFLESLWLGDETRPLIKHVVIVAMDPTAYERCVFKGVLNCYLLPNHTGTEDADCTGEKVYMTKGFIDMMWRRTFFLVTVLKKGYNFVFTDTDILWLRNPFTRLNIDEPDDIKFSSDQFNGNRKSVTNPINTGFYHVKSNTKTIALFERWFSMHDKSPGMKEQDVMQKLIRGGILRELDLNATFLDTRYFSGFCQESPNPTQVVTVHANCCRYIAAKAKDLGSVLNDWKRLKTTELVNGSATDFAWSPHVNCLNSWHH